MQVPPDANGRVRELVAQLQTEQDPEKITIIVEELNRLLDDETRPNPSQS